MEPSSQHLIDEVLAQYPMQGKVGEAVPFGNGHINDTYVIPYTYENGAKSRILLQRINTHIFRNPQGLMKNLAAVAAFMKEKVILAGGDPLRETLTLIPASNGEDYVRDSQGNYWRQLLHVDDTITYEQIPNEDVFNQAAQAFGTFQRRLADYPAHTLIETIPNFHYTPARYNAFLSALKDDAYGRAPSARPEIDFVLAHQKDTAVLTDMMQAGQLPLRVTHNDTKLNNVLFDRLTGKSLCVIDLDTVMPGLSLYDFGDAIRFGASTAAEDETDLDKVTLSLSYYNAFAQGFMQTAGDILTDEEKRMMPMGAKVITLECGIRFLTDYLQGDTYFKIHRPHHNLERARTQFKLVGEMEQKWDALSKIM